MLWPHRMQPESLLSRLAGRLNDAVASPWAPFIAIAVVAAWLLAGPDVTLPESRVGVIHLAIAIVTLLLVFILEHNSARNERAIQIKLDEIIDVLQADRDKVGIERLDDDELRHLQRRERERIRHG